MSMTKKPINKPGRTSFITKAGLGLILIGFLAAAINLLGIWHSQHNSAQLKPLSQVLNNSQPIANQKPLVSGTPVHIKVPSVGIDINVIPGYYYPKTQSWTLSNNNAQYGVITAKANNKSGGTFIYG